MRNRSIAAALAVLLMLGYAGTASASANINSSSSQTFTVGQAAAAASNVTVTDDPATPTITAANGLRIRIPITFNMTWDTTVTTVTLSGTAAGKVSTTLGAYEDSSHTLVLNVTADFAAGQTLTISGLRFANFTAASASDNLQLVIAGSGGATANFDFRTETVQVPTATLISGSSQTFSVGQPATAASNPTVTDDPAIPTIKAANGLRIRIPTAFNMVWDTTVTTVTLSGTAAGKVSTTLGAYEDSSHTLVLNVTADFTAGQTLTISGLRFTGFTAVSATDFLQVVVAGAGGATASLDFRSKTIQVPTPTLNSASNQTFSIGQPATAASTPTVTDDAGVATIKAANGIRIRIPAAFNMTWDTTVTTVTLTGTAAGKVSTTLGAYEDSNHTLVLNVTADFSVGQTLTISGLRFNNFTAVSNYDSLQLVVTGAGGATASLDNRWKNVQVPTATLSSASSQSFVVGQAAAGASNPTVTDDAGVATIKAANGLRLRIPSGLYMSWDTTVTTVTLSGTAAGKVNTTLGAYEDGGQTLVLNVTADFTVGQTLTISGLKFANFTAGSFGNLQVVTAGAEGATASADNRSKIIGQPGLSSAANQTFMVGQAATAASTPTVTEDSNVTTITSANGLRIRIPATFNMTWDTTVTTVTLSGSAAGKVSATLGAYEDGNHTLVLTVTSNFSAQDTLSISGLRFANFTAVSAADYLQLVILGAGAATATTDTRSKTITGVKFYLHDAATTDTGSLPASTSLSATSPGVTASTAGSNRSMDQTAGTAQVSAALTTLAQTSLQTSWFRRFLSAPLAAQTLPTGVWTVQGGASESSNNSNMFPWGTVLKVWRPSTGATVATLLDNPRLGTVKPNTTETNMSSATTSISGVAVNSGDLLVLELWAQNTQNNATARTNTIYYDGTIEASTSSNAAFLQAPGAIIFAASTVGSAVGYKISYSNYGLFCLSQAMTITVVDSGGNPVTGYTGTANLTTTTGRGTWTKTAGNGTLSDPVPDDGAASYVWNGADTSASFALSYKAGGPLVTANAVDSVSTGIHDDGTQGAITFSPSGFTVTSAPFSNPAGGVPAFASPQTAGSGFNLYLTAYGQTPTDATCGIITGYAGAKSIKFWSTYANPATGTIAPTVNGTTIATAEGSASAQSVTFTSGQATVAANYKDAGSLSIAMKDDTTGNPGLPTGVRGSTGTWVSRPANFLVSNIKRSSDAFANPAASTASGTVFIGAGQAFAATVTAVEAGGATTPNYGRESSPASASFTATLVLPAAGNTPAVAGTAGTFTSGVATGTAFSWPEVGIIRLVPHVAGGSYLGAGDVVGSATGNVGRFVPNNLATVLNTPVFGTGCSAGSFSYVGQPFTYTVAPVITVTAQALGGATTQNYTGTLLRLTNASMTGRSYTPTPASPALDTSGLPATGTDPVVADLGAGQATLSFSAGSGLAFSRGSASAPFNANIALSINVIDLDGVTAANPVSFGTGAGIAFSTGAAQRYGRLRLRNRVGSELLDLPMSLTTEYYLSTTQGFVTNTDDSCTVAPTLAFSNYQQNLSAGKTCVRDAGNPGTSGAGCAAVAAVSVGCPDSAGTRYRPSAQCGDFNLNLAAPGSGNSGAVTVTATAPGWLQYLWNAGSGSNSNPSGMATFGMFPGPTSRIYQREVY